MVSPSRCPPWQPERPGPTRREPRRAQRSYTTPRDTIVFADIPGYIPTALVGLTLDDAERICNRLNARLGLDYDAWSAIAGRAMSAARDETTH